MTILPILLLQLLLPPDPGSKSGPADDLVRASMAVSRVTLEAFVPRVTPGGQPVLLTVRITNGSRGDITCISKRPAYGRIEVFGPDLRPVKMTLDGSNESAPNLDALAILGAGALDHFEVDLRRWTDFDRPGRYTLRNWQKFMVGDVGEHRSLNIIDLPFFIGAGQGNDMVIPD